MKRVITMFLVISMIACMIPAFAVTTSAATAGITIDGDLSDWEGTKTQSVIGSGEYDGKKVTFYGVLADEGLYVAADAYHGTYRTDAGNWWENTNLELFIDRKAYRDDSTQVWLSAQGMSDTNKNCAKSNNNIVAQMITTQVTDAGVAGYHTIAEMFLSKEDFELVRKNIRNDEIMVGMAWKTPGDNCNNGEAGGGNANEYWVPKGSWPDNLDRLVVKADGVYTQNELYGGVEWPIGKKSEWSYLTATQNPNAAGDGWNTAVNADWAKANAPFGDRAEGATRAWGTTGEGDGAQNNAYLWVAKEFTIDDLDAIDGKSLFTNMFYDDDIRLYVNGTLVYQHDAWNDGYETYMLALNAADILVEGKNVIAASLHQHTGGYEFDLELYISKRPGNVDGRIPRIANISTADELIAYVEAANLATKVYGNATRLAVLNIAADIDLTDKAWTPINAWIGTINGNGHTISGITYITDAESGNFGLLVNDLTNDNAYGTIQDLTIKNSTIVAKATNGYVGGVAGYANRGRVMNCAVENVTVIGNTVSGGVVGGACWATGSLNGQWVIEIINNKVKNSTVVAISAEDGKAGGIAGINYWDDIISLGDYTLENVTLMGKATGATVADAQGRTPPQGANATATNVTTNETVTVPALGEGQATKAWDAQNPTEVKIAVTAVSKTLTAVKVNGNTLKASNYTVTATDDGFAVTLTESYLKTLKAGSYKIVIETYLGNTQEVTLSVAEGAPGTVPVPPTGDAAMAAAVVAIVSIFALAAVVARKKRQLV